MKFLPGLRRPTRRSAKSFKDNEEGVTAIEFGLVAIPYLVLVLGILELGLTLGGQYSLNYGVSSASRSIRTGQSQAWSRAEFVTEICRFAVMLSDCQNKIRVDVQSANDFQGLQSVSTASFLDPNGGVAAQTNGTGQNAYAFDQGTRKTPVIVTVGYEWTLVGFLGNGAIGSIVPLSLANLGNGNRLIVATELFRNEPF